MIELNGVIEGKFQNFLENTYLNERIELRASFMTGCSEVFFLIDAILHDKNSSTAHKIEQLRVINDELMIQHLAIMGNGES